MVNKSLLAVISLLVLSMLACSATFNIPSQKIKTGPTQTDEINVAALPAGEVADLRLEFGAGELTLNPGDQDMLVTGTATYNVEAAQTGESRSTGMRWSSSNGDLKFNTLPVLKDFKNEWDLALGLDPMNLDIQAGAYQGTIELGGLALHSLKVADGAANVELTFSSPTGSRWTPCATRLALRKSTSPGWQTLISRI